MLQTTESSMQNGSNKTINWSVRKLHWHVELSLLLDTKVPHTLPKIWIILNI